MLQSFSIGLLISAKTPELRIEAFSILCFGNDSIIFKPPYPTKQLEQIINNESETRMPPPFPPPPRHGHHPKPQGVGLKIPGQIFALDLAVIPPTNYISFLSYVTVIMDDLFFRYFLVRSTATGHCQQ